MYYKLVTKVNNIDTSGFVLKTKYDADAKFNLNLEKKIPDISGFVKKADHTQKVCEIESKIPSISGLATTSGLTAVENKIPDISSLVKKQIIRQNLAKLKEKLLTIVMINTLLLHNLISLKQEFLLQD